MRSKIDVESEVRYFMHPQQDAEKAAFIEGAKWAMRQVEGALEDLNVK